MNEKNSYIIDLRAVCFLSFATFVNQASCGTKLRINPKRASNTDDALKPYIHGQNPWHVVRRKVPFRIKI